MSWRCPKCGNRNADSDTSCSDCGYHTENKSNPDQGKWIIVCPDCGREIPVAGEDAELERCPECGNDSIETVRASFKAEEGPARADEPPEPRPRMLIREIRAIPEISNKFIYRQKGRTPEFISDEIEILPPEKEFGRNDLPEQGDYYRTISERHCRFRRDDNGDWFVSDLNSTNGTIVDGRRLVGKAEARLAKDSEIQMANRLFAVFME